jgi:nucleoid-associated protein YgaU
VRKGDTLSAIARRHYGTSRGYLRIRAANRRAIRSANMIHPCQRIYLPRLARRG